MLTIEAPTKVQAPPEIRRGVEILDERGPEGWRERIDLDRLNIAQARDCILGQCFGMYADGREAMNLTHAEVRDCGFVPTFSHSSSDLTASWHDYLAATRA